MHGMVPDAGSGEVSAEPEQVSASSTFPFCTSRKTAVGEPMAPVPVMTKIPSAETGEERGKVGGSEERGGGEMHFG
jgi:hypothetical protein